MFEGHMVFSENRDGPVMTIAITNRAFINLDSDNNILNFNGEIAAVVHQYDRKEDLVEIANEKYYPELNNKKENNDKKNNDNNSYIKPIYVIICFIGVLLFSLLLYFIITYRFGLEIWTNFVNKIQTNDKNEQVDKGN